jgi:PAS domain S-box-containing protein
MEAVMRHSGIEFIGDVPWGTHFCQFYETAQDLIDTLVPYFREGLNNNEFCMWVTSEPLQVDQAKASLQAVVPNLDQYFEKGQIEILDYNQWYTRSGKFSADEVLQGWVDKLNSALECGYEGLRLTGNTFLLEQSNWADFTKYEETVNNVIGQYRMLAICTYSLRKCGSMEILDVLANHQFALVKHFGKWGIVESAHQKEIEQALRESEYRYRELVDAAPDAIIVHRGGDVLYANSAALKLYGATDFEQLAAHNVLKLVPHDNIRTTIDRWKMVMDGQKVPLREARIFRLDGQEVPIEVGLSPIEYEGGRAIQAIIRDITDRKKAEERLRTTLESIDDGFFALDADWRFVYVNARAGRILGINPKEVLDKNHWDVFPLTLGTNLEREYRRAAAGEVRDFENFYEPWGRWFHNRCYPREGGGMSVYFEDITEHKLQEERIVKLSRLYSVLSHVNEAIVRTHDENVLCSEVCRIVADEGDFPLVWIGEVKGIQVVPVAWHGGAKNFLNESKFEMEGDLVQVQ